MGRHPENIPVPGVVIVRLDAPLYYANALTVRDTVKSMLEESEAPPRAVIFDASVQDDLDFTGAEVLSGLVKELQGKGITVLIAEVHAPVREFARKTGLLDLVGEKNIFPTVELAVRSVETSNPGGAQAP
jgi:MFS superfamily sulfate permease-like transporter